MFDGKENNKIAKHYYNGHSFAFAFYSVEASAETQLPQNYGAKGALQDSSITLEEALTYAIQDEYLAQARYDTIMQNSVQLDPLRILRLQSKDISQHFFLYLKSTKLRFLKTMQNCIQKNLVL